MIARQPRFHFDIETWAPVALTGMVCLAVVLFGNALWMKVFISVAIFTLTSASIAFLYRCLGLVSLAHVALMGVGGWVTLRLVHAYGLPFEVNMLAGGLITMALGALLAYPAMRMRSLYLALVTLMMAGAFFIFINVVQFPNGGAGFFGFEIKSITYIPRPALAQSDPAYFLYCVALAFLGFLLIRWHELGKAGRGWLMIRQSEAVAMATGVNVTVYKVWAFGLSGFLAGIAGGLLAGPLQFLNPSTFPVAESVLIFALTVVGGSWNWYGCVIAALLYRFVPSLLDQLGVSGDAGFIIFGAALIHALVTAPRGLAGQIHDALFAEGPAS
jgi:branched-chain amino acid transport system permease protein